MNVGFSTRHAIFATVYLQAGKHGIRHILSGTNVVTETTLPPHSPLPSVTPTNCDPEVDFMEEEDDDAFALGYMFCSTTDRVSRHSLSLCGSFPERLFCFFS